MNICYSFIFTDDLAAVLGGNMGHKYTSPFLDLAQKLKMFFVNLEYYAILSVQPVNLEKTEALWSARAMVLPNFSIYLGETKIKWIKEYKYLGYWQGPRKWGGVGGVHPPNN